MAKKTDINQMLEKYGPMLKKFGNEVGAAAKKGEENVVIMSKLLKIHLDIVGATLQKEKLYYDIGKEVADKLMKGSLSIEGLEKYKKALQKMQKEKEKKKRAMSNVKLVSKKKTRKTGNKK